MAVADDDVHILVIRVWREPGADPPFRARITFGDRQPAVGAVTSDPEDVMESVRSWLSERAHDRAGRDGGATSLDRE